MAKLSHRRVKKAMKKGHQTPRERVMIQRAARRTRKRMDAAFKAMQTHITLSVARSQVLRIASKPRPVQMSKTEMAQQKAMALIEVVNNTANAIASIYKQNL